MDSRILNVVVKGDSMWPTLSDGETVQFEKINPNNLEVGQIVLTTHPLKSKIMIIKRIKSLNEERVFLIGDNPDPNASEDSHNFGPVKQSEILATLAE
ncbi:nickel-type superoxide dismutase maturation protease [Euryarchaeota archaeon]|nr:nickel-type superoxide dismutase maturation protease [Euryarchaeota archaeon]MDC1029272.1 nickel-type superoxide dismutase maturation protease [Euryarchaeota archaeon]